MNPMLTLSVSAVLFLASSVFSNDREKFMEARTFCMNQTGATLEMVQNYKPGEEKPSDEILCFIKCNLEKMGYVKDDGTICIDTMKEQKFPEGSEETKEKIYECLEKVPKIDTCDDAWPLEECFVKN